MSAQKSSQTDRGRGNSFYKRDVEISEIVNDVEITIRCYLSAFLGRTAGFRLRSAGETVGITLSFIILGGTEAPIMNSEGNVPYLDAFNLQFGAHYLTIS